ncbi:nucleotide exchange factor GrpE, partial [Patescibacteria group bacterium]|nr:nucleotide exchange factor GrpE [Patescibacteria group bacterium]
MDEQNPLSEQNTSAAEPASATSCPNCEQYLAGWKRAQADYQNLQKQMELDRVERAKFANERLLSSLLPAIDQFSLALSFIPSTDVLPEAEKKTWNTWLVGVKAVYSLWNQTATQAGLEVIPTSIPFDPQLHEAVAEEASDQPEGTIVRVVQPGWRLHGKVLQPARVMVA